jgi:hypothetical protein
MIPSSHQKLVAAKLPKLVRDLYSRASQRRIILVCCIPPSSSMLRSYHIPSPCSLEKKIAEIVKAKRVSAVCQPCPHHPIEYALAVLPTWVRLSGPCLDHLPRHVSSYLPAPSPPLRGWGCARLRAESNRHADHMYISSPVPQVDEATARGEKSTARRSLARCGVAPSPPHPSPTAAPTLCMCG